MKKIVLTFGLIAGVILSAFMVATLPYMKSENFDPDRSQVMGYTAIVLAFLLVFFGIRSYRENVGGGVITFGRAFAVGILVTVVASLFYVATWLVVYYNFVPDFADTYAACVIKDMREDGASPADIAKKQEQMVMMKRWLQNPLINGAVTFLEPFPVGLLVTLISAAILRRKTPPSPAGATAAIA